MQESALFERSELADSANFREQHPIILCAESVTELDGRAVVDGLIRIRGGGVEYDDIFADFFYAVPGELYVIAAIE